MNDTVGDWMTADVVTVSRYTKLAEAMTAMRSRGIRHVCVLETDGRLAGILSDRDVTRVLPSVFGEGAHGEYGRVLESTRVESAMTTRPIVTTAEAALGDTESQMERLRIGALPVVEAHTGRLVGIVSRGDCRRAATQTALANNTLAA